MSMCTTELVVILTLIITTFFVLNGKITVGAMIMSIQLANQVVNEKMKNRKSKRR